MELAKRPNTELREYLYLHEPTNELLLLFQAPVPGAVSYDLEVEGDIVLTDLYYIGEL